MIASERTADGKDWDWRTFGTGYGFVADCIVAGLLASRNYNEETGEGFYINLDTGEASMNNAHLKGEIESKRDGYGLYVSITPGAVSLLSDYNGKKVSVFRMSGGTTLDEETGELRGVSPYITLGPKSSSFAIQFSDSVLTPGGLAKTGSGTRTLISKAERPDGSNFRMAHIWMWRTDGCPEERQKRGNSNGTAHQQHVLRTGADDGQCPVHRGLSDREWLDQNAVAGILGNMEQESTMNPGLWQDLKYENMSGGYGLVQWTPATEYTSWADRNGYPWGGDTSSPTVYVNGQLERILWEVRYDQQWIATSAFPFSFTAFTQSGEAPEYLAEAFMKNYERPGIRSWKRENRMPGTGLRTLLMEKARLRM